MRRVLAVLCAALVACGGKPAASPGALVIPQGFVPATPYIDGARVIDGGFLPWQRAQAWTFVADLDDELELETRAFGPPLGTVVRLYESLPDYTSEPALVEGHACDEVSAESCLSFKAPRAGRLFLVVHRADLGRDGAFTLSLRCVRAGDGDCDGVREVDDCDDSDPASHTRVEVAPDVFDPDGLPDFEVDGDCDGARAAEDCDDTNPVSTTRFNDADCDGVETAADCDDGARALGDRALDGDCDGVKPPEDCDDADPASTTRPVDGDCDGVRIDADCDDADAASTVRASDGDCDGVETADDCDDGAPEGPIDAASATSTTRANDADCDGVETADDCDDTSVDSTTRASDGDCDGVETAADCDDTSADSTTRASDGDCDGVETAADCDDTSADSTTRALDGDCDGIPADADCDDTRPNDADCDGRPDPPGFVRVPAGTFTAGSPSNEVGRETNEQQVEVTLTRAFWVGVNEVTQAEWMALSGGANPSTFEGCDACPVETVTWWSALGYANARSEADGVAPCYGLPTATLDGGPCTGTWQAGDLDCGDAVPEVGDVYACEGYRLPTEAEWEYAARAGTGTATFGGDLSGESGCETVSGAGRISSGTPFAALTWYLCNSAGSPHPVGLLSPNGWGLYDVLGNVEEWTWDREWTDAQSERGVASGTDPARSEPGRGGERVFRGGSWRDAPRDVRAAARRAVFFAPEAADERGLRLVRSSR